MGIRKQAGFTVIEVMLFLSISGFLVALMLVGVGNSLNNQRYKDAVESFKSLIQEQYSDIANTQNSRSDNWSCNSTATAVQGGSGTKTRGQTSCMLVGKYIRIVKDDITVYNVLAAQINSSTGLDDVASLRTNYALKASSSDKQKSTMDWGTQLAWPKSGDGYQNPTTPRSTGILVLRSPDSGLIYTFSSSTVPSTDTSPVDFADLLQAGATIPGQGGRTLCIDSGSLVTGGNMAVTISAYASGPSAVRTRTNETPGASNVC